MNARRLGRRILLTAWLVFCPLAPYVVADPPQQERVLILRPEQKEFEEPIRVMMEEWEYEGDFQVELFKVKERTRVRELRRVIQRIKPNGIVMMGNSSINLYREYQENAEPGTQFPPALAVMAAYVREQIKGIENVNGIAYEAQAASALPNLRYLVADEVQRVGIVYSDNLREFFDQQKESTKDEQIELVGISLDTTKGRVERRISEALKELIEKEKVDAIWVLNDNPLLERDLLRWGWIPSLNEVNIPVLVSIERLATRFGKVGPFAVVPDHTRLGRQVANLVTEIWERGWVLREQQKTHLPHGGYDFKYNMALIPKSLKLDDRTLQDEWVPINEKRRRRP
ncbi:MAG: hypothetical protein QNK37_03070 [Acidobacteriota bacterium]|nr:hypothetical protein [Acidobacteriota bacterium]